MKKIGGWMKKHKKLTALIIVLLVLLALFLWIRGKTKAAMAQLSEMTEETAVVERRSLVSSVTATGKVMSDNTRNITTTLTGIDVLTVNVKEGDVVAVGDVLATFDTEKIEGKLEDAEKSLNVSEKQSGINVDAAKRSLAQAIETRDYQVESAARSVLSASDNYSSANSAYSDAQSALSGLAAAQNTASSAIAAAESEYKLTTQYAAYETAKAAYASATTASPTDAAAISAADKALSDATYALQTTYAYSQYLSAQNDLAAAKKAYDAQKSAMGTLKSALDTASNAYDTAVNAYNYTIDVQNRTADGSFDSVESARLTASVGSLTHEDAVETYREQLEKGQLIASIPGTVTAVNIKEGDTYTGGAIVTIQDCSQFVVSAEIDEYDIADVEVGMKAIFRTDATRDVELEGEVIFVSPTPTEKSDVTYQVKVSIKSDASRLRLGMNAKLNIILTETEGVLTVPYDAVQQDESGNDVVYVVTRREEGGTIKTAVPVKVGIEGDYYVEVTGELTEGMEVSMPSDELADVMSMVMGG